VVLLLLNVKVVQRLRQCGHMGATKSSTTRSGGDKRLGGAGGAETGGDRATSAQSASCLASGFVAR
jgi:hypothetical protein